LYLFAVPEDGLVGLVFNMKPGSSGMANDPDHSNRILVKSFIGFTDRSDDLLLEVGHPADVIDDGEICNIIKETIHRDIAPQSVFRRSSKTVCPNDIPFFCLDFLKFRPTSKSGYFDDLSSFEENMNQSESTADNAAVSKEAIDLMGVGVGGYIEILRGFSEEKIPDASTDEISHKSMLMETIEDFQCFIINHSTRNRMFCSWNDELDHFLPFERAGTCPASPALWPWSFISENGVIITEFVQEARHFIRKFCHLVTLI